MSALTIPLERTCYKCKVPKELTEFPRDRCHSTGYGHRCKACRRAYDGRVGKPQGQKAVARPYDYRTLVPWLRWLTPEEQTAIKATARFGLTLDEADRIAISIGVHPGEIWECYWTEEWND